MLPFFQNELGYSLPMRLLGQFVTKGLPQPWRILGKIFTRLIWEGLHYSRIHPTAVIPYPRFTKIIIDHFITKNHDIPKRLHEHYYRVANDEIVKSIFNSRKNKEGEGMRIPEWMLTKEMELTRHCQLYASVFWVEVPMT
ncbi:hypothetical protein Tco_0104919 [Tanacetum coccineum]